MADSTKRVVMSAVSAALAVLPLGVVATPASAAPPRPLARNWASWLGSTSTESATTLRQVRTVIGADTTATAALTGRGVGVALIDTGVAPVPGLPAGRIVNGPDLSMESQAPQLRYLDTFGHGTHMAGIIVGNDAATGTVGLAPDVKLTSIKVGTATGTVDVSQVIAAVDWVVAHRNDDTANPIKVINLSYGSGGTPNTWNDSLGFAVEKAWQAGIVVVAAAGNDGNGAGVLANPASDEWIITVGATATKGTATTYDDELTTFTNLPKAGKQINVLAPGTSILSLRDNGSSVDLANPSARVGDTLFRGSGTSQAAAVTSAAVALLLQAKPWATPDQIKEWLIRSATYLPYGTAAALGLKEINVNAALARSGSAVQAQSWNRSSGAGTLDNARGDSRVMFDNVPLSGQRSVWGPLATSGWAAKSAAGAAWAGGVWMGYRLAGDGWTGTSWASRTWSPAVWSNSAPWTGASTTWADPSWSGRSWSGRSWSAGAWSGRSWSSDDWSSASWS
ncbi:S8 family serine peptidase [Actinoplanes friuliensis]|uniref:Peptidase S8 and S53 subtilisin kexin sedolisin n=1 Tax=Actinoplanes friuliensis DSM 7358 TaxID=1246995 RepID=U5W7C6_9ACTN|nr:S8 family serine peptidase [Actinoplanes friuliensis]AGZ45073.1 peptidase S8 and S53 subtilisin kexin sedolisin [Actinoplanes friuliensis DSM 7358]